MSPKERRQYDAHMDTIMVQNDVLDTARDEGIAEGLKKGREEGLVKGREEGRAEDVASVVRNLIASGMNDELILTATGISREELDEIRETTGNS